VSTRVSPPQPHWTIPGLIDLEYLLDREGEQVDAEFFEEEVEPWIDPAKIDRPDSATVSAALWQWLERRRRNLADADLPGRAFAGAQTAVTLGAVAVMFASAASLVFGLLRYDARTYNVLVLLTLTVGLPWLLLVLGLAGYLTWGLWRRSAFLSLAQQAFFSLTNRLIRRPLGVDAVNWWRERGRSRRLFTLPALALTQTAALAFSLGALAAFLTAVLFLSVRFGWETTATETLAPTLHRGAVLLATPWSWAQPGWVPSLEQIEQSRITWSSGRPRLPPPSLAEAWVPFLTLTLFVWGVLPRLLLRAGVALRLRRAVSSYSFLERSHREWWRHLTDLPFEVQVSGPTDGAFAILWGGVRPERERLRAASLHQLRLNIEAQAEAGGETVSGDTAALESLRRDLRTSPDHRVILVAEGWSLSPKDFAAFHEDLRSTIGETVPIDVLLLGLAGDASALAPPAASDVSVWESFVAGLQDPNLYLHPYRAEGAPPAHEPV